jgi:hypothetical protein
MNEEIKEWLGIKPADFATYVAMGAIVWMYFTKSVALDVILSVVAVGSCGLACFIGVRPDGRLAATTNFLKRVTYPACLVAAIVCVYLNFSRWNGL